MSKLDQTTAQARKAYDEAVTQAGKAYNEAVTQVIYSVRNVGRRPSH